MAHTQIVHALHFHSYDEGEEFHTQFYREASAASFVDAEDPVDMLVGLLSVSFSLRVSDSSPHILGQVLEVYIQGRGFQAPPRA